MAIGDCHYNKKSGEKKDLTKTWLFFYMSKSFKIMLFCIVNVLRVA